MLDGSLVFEMFVECASAVFGGPTVYVVMLRVVRG